jgi:uncharacterized membrane protein YuzA (DUF378 family)
MGFRNYFSIFDITTKPPANLMMKIIAYVCIGLCVVIMVYLLKIYLEMPKIKKLPKDRKDKYIF